MYFLYIENQAEILTKRSDKPEGLDGYSLSDSPSTQVFMKNAVSWFDIPTENFKRAWKFYSDILGEEIILEERLGQRLGFFPADYKNGVGGDLVPPGAGHKPSAEGTRIYLNCNDKIDEVLNRVEVAGGKILQPKFSIGRAGWIAIIRDTEGNTIGLHSL